MYASSNYADLLRTFPSRYIFIVQAATDYILYFKTFEANSRKLCAEYSKEMTFSDILDLNGKYFKEFGDEIIEPQIGKVYIFAYDANYLSAFSPYLMELDNYLPNRKTFQSVLPIISELSNYLS